MDISYTTFNDYLKKNVNTLPSNFEDYIEPQPDHAKI